MEQEILRWLSVILALFSFGYILFNLTKGVNTRNLLRFVASTVVMLVLLQTLAICLNLFGHK